MPAKTKNTDTPRGHDVSFRTYDDIVSSTKSEITPVVDGLFYPGIYLFGGPPKSGKSYFMAQLTYHVASGQNMWNRAVRKGPVLYFSLDDSPERVTARIQGMFGMETGLDVSFVSARALRESGLPFEQYLARYLSMRPAPRLLIVDMVHQIRGSESGTDYRADYDLVGRYREQTDGLDLVSIFLTHTVKSKSSRIGFSEFYGSAGMLGAVDAGMILQPDSSHLHGGDAVLSVTGRDQPNEEISLIRGRQTGAWEEMTVGLGTKPEAPLPDLPLMIRKLVNADNPWWSGSATDLAKELRLNMNPSLLSRELNRIRETLREWYGIHTDHSRNNSRREIIFTYDPAPARKGRTA